MPNPFLYKQKVLFQTIQFSMQFTVKNTSISSIQLSQTVLIQFSISFC